MAGRRIDGRRIGQGVGRIILVLRPKVDEEFQLTLNYSSKSLTNSSSKSSTFLRPSTRVHT